ncbi:uncharacterized protein [Oscarella lobularis]|uniref:uncharacterized protein isoform X1 n=1 Tax=Oscarella lobularis TaxID=121494 RepID=UPI0033134ECC
MDRNLQRAYKARGLSAEDRRFRKDEEEHDRRRTKRHDALNARRNRVRKTSPPKRHIAPRSTTQDEGKSMCERLVEFKKRIELKKRQETMEKAKKKPFVLVSKTKTIPERLEPVKKIGFTSATTVDSRRQAISLRNKPAMPVPSGNWRRASRLEARRRRLQSLEKSRNCGRTMRSNERISQHGKNEGHMWRCRFGRRTAPFLYGRIVGRRKRKVDLNKTATFDLLYVAKPRDLEPWMSCRYDVDVAAEM